MPIDQVMRGSLQGHRYRDQVMRGSLQGHDYRDQVMLGSLKGTNIYHVISSIECGYKQLELISVDCICLC